MNIKLQDGITGFIGFSVANVVLTLINPLSWYGLVYIEAMEAFLFIYLAWMWSVQKVKDNG